MPFEPQNIPPNFFVGEITAFAVLDPAGLQPTNVIRTTDTWHVSISWRIRGTVVNALAGNWQVRAFLESMGAGFEGQVGPIHNQNLNTDQFDPREYTALITVPPGTPAGTYKLVVVVNYFELSGQPGFMAGHQEGPIVQIFNP